MRPHAHHERSTPESGRIIYLGDVRRRRRPGRAPDRHYLVAVGLMAAAGWGVWLAVLFNLSPARLLTYLAFLTPLGVAVAASGAIAAYAVEWRLGRIPDLGASTRRGIILAALVIGNLAVLAAHRWTPAVAGGLLLLAGGLEAFLIYRESWRR